MATWIGCIVETKARADFWDAVKGHNIRPSTSSVPPYVLIECDHWANFNADIQLAENISRELQTSTIGFYAQTTAGVQGIHAFANGARVRRLEYTHDKGGWDTIEGSAQPWEADYFFDDGTTVDGGSWPSMLYDDLEEADIARYEQAKAARDASSILALLHPSSTLPLLRMCESLGIARGEASAWWKRPSIWSRLFG